MSQWDPPGRPEPVTAPPDVRTAHHLWWGVIGLGIVRLIVGAVDRFVHRHQLTRDLLDQMRERQPQVSDAQVELVVPIMQVLMVVFGLALAVGAWAVAHQLRLGRPWARTVLDVATAVLVFGAIRTMVALGQVVGVGPVVTGAVAILQAVLAGGALFLCRRGESEAFFRVKTR